MDNGMGNTLSRPGCRANWVPGQCQNSRVCSHTQTPVAHPPLAVPGNPYRIYTKSGYYRYIPGLRRYSRTLLFSTLFAARRLLTTVVTLVLAVIVAKYGYVFRAQSDAMIQD